MNMKEAFDRTKVVVRHLPPAISMATLMEQIDGSFSGRYDWVSFHPGKTSLRNQTFSRAYIDFKRPEDVLEFAEFFNGHMFVNEKGIHYKTIVEYAPSQRVPKHWFSKDGREGTIFKDPEYMGFLEFLAKPVENLPSAELQLERREAERSGMAKEFPIVTPLMDFVRQKRASRAKYGKSVANGKLGRRAGGASGKGSSSASKRGPGKKKISTMQYVLRDSSRSTSGKDNPKFVLFAKCDDQKLSGKTTGDVSNILIDVGNSDGAKKKVLLLKSKEKETFQVTERTSVKHICGSAVSSSNSQRESGARTIRSMSSSKDVHQSLLSGDKTEQRVQASSLEGKRPPRPPKETNGSADGRSRGSKSHGFHGEKSEKRTRYKDKSDHGNSGDVPNSRNGEVKTLGSGYSSSYLSEKSSTIISHGGTAENVKDLGNVSSSYDKKHAKRGAASGYGAQEKQVWIQKSSFGS